eukprot:m.6657 g.6657  ORF g.6657 m.6657 type:complete len:652 (+) comp3870_c0_seq1:1-1956(+)
MKCGMLPFTVAAAIAAVAGGAASPLPSTPPNSPCNFVPGTAFETAVPGGEGVILKMPMTSQWECCAVCRREPRCFVGNYVADTKGNHGKPSDWNITGVCYMRGRVDTTKPTAKPNVTACLVEQRPPPMQPTPKGALNVLYVVSDDMRPELPPYGQHHVIAPNFERFAASATTFDRAYCQQSICSPSRNSFMSGRRPDRTGVFNFVNDFRDFAAGAEWLSLPQYFKQFNYTVLGHSKLFHRGHPENNDEPLSWTQEQPYVSQVGVGENPPGCGYFDVCPIPFANQTVDYQIVSKAVATIAMAARMRRPFFIGVGLIRPHLPFVAPRALYNLYNESAINITANVGPPLHGPGVALNDCVFAHANWSYHDPLGIKEQYTNMTPYTPYPPDAQRFLRHGYYAAITHVDQQVGRLLDALEDAGVADRTVVAFHGDHGWHLGEQGEWTKKTNFELGTRVPLLIRAPQHPASFGTHAPGLAELIDVYPTLADLAGLPPPPDIDGTSLKSAFLPPGHRAPVSAEGGVSTPTGKQYAFSQFPQCPIDPTGKTLPIWHAKMSCQGYPREKIPIFGYSVRSEDWRYTEWYYFRCPAWPTDCGVDWAAPPIATELYNHSGGVAAMQDYDNFDVVNLAGDPQYANVTQALHAVLRMQFTFNSTA